MMIVVMVLVRGMQRRRGVGYRGSRAGVEHSSVSGPECACSLRRARRCPNDRRKCSHNHAPCTMQAQCRIGGKEAAKQARNTGYSNQGCTTPGVCRKPSMQCSCRAGVVDKGDTSLASADDDEIRYSEYSTVFLRRRDMCDFCRCGVCLQVFAVKSPERVFISQSTIHQRRQI